jgi:hypothetical protein
MAFVAFTVGTAVHGCQADADAAERASAAAARLLTWYAWSLIGLGPSSSLGRVAFSGRAIEARVPGAGQRIYRQRFA